MSEKSIKTGPVKSPAGRAKKPSGTSSPMAGLLKKWGLGFETIMESLRDGVYITDHHGCFVYVNGVIEARSGRSAAALEGRRFLDIVSPKDQQRVKEDFENILKGKESEPYAMEYLRSNGMPAMVEIHSRAIQKEGRVIGVLGISRDISDRMKNEEAMRFTNVVLENRVEKRTAALMNAVKKLEKQIQERLEAEAALKTSEKKYRLLVETMNEGFAIQDESGVLTYVNDKYCRILGYEKEALIGRSSLEFLDLQNKRIFLEQLEARRHGGNEIYEIAFTHKDGKKIHVITSPRSMYDEKGRFIGSFAVLTDISPIKAVAWKLRKREQELEIKTVNLEEANTALKVLLKKREEDKAELEKKVLFNIKELVEPYLEKLKQSGLNETQKALVGILGEHLKDISSAFSHHLSSSYLGLTPMEIQVANLVRQGWRTKDMAGLLHLSKRTVEVHRRNIRKKLDLRNKKINLRSYLMSLP